jgi:hypothetical protein
VWYNRNITNSHTKGEKSDTLLSSRECSTSLSGSEQNFFLTYKVVGISFAIDKILSARKFVRQRLNLSTSVPTRIVDIFVTSTRTLFNERIHITAKLWENNLRADYHRNKDTSYVSFHFFVCFFEESSLIE